MAQMKSVIPLADVMKVSDEESLLLTGAADYEEAADQLLSNGLKLVAITLGSKGALVATSTYREIVKAFPVNAVDTTGAGDSFWGGFLSCYLSYDKKMEDLGWKTQKMSPDRNATAGLCVQKQGRNSFHPIRKEIEEFIRERTDR